MKAIFIVAFAAVAVGLAAFISFGFQRAAAVEIPYETKSETSFAISNRQPVLVELFTSEGCSSCPPADRVLTTLQNDQLVPNAEVITLEFHVDYWNYLGWKDRFSSNEFTKRQEAYARQLGLNSTYTPQMVVDGSREFVGSSRAKANETIAQSAAEPKAAVEVTVVDGKLHVTVKGLKEHSDATVYLAVAENKLFTKVGGGENSGSTLEHTSVVRSLTPIGTIKKAENGITTELSVPKNAGWNVENTKYVVFVQENSTLKVLAVGPAAMSASNSGRLK